MTTQQAKIGSSARIWLPFAPFPERSTLAEIGKTLGRKDLVFATRPRHEILPCLWQCLTIRGSVAGHAAAAEPESECVCGAVVPLGEAGVLSKLILYGEAVLRWALTEYTERYHSGRNHQGKENQLRLPRRVADRERWSRGAPAL